jgi:ribosomal-protein-alanine N-acetyltransferase
VGSPPMIALRPFQSSDTSFFIGMARDDRVTRFVGDGQPWQNGLISARVSAALELLPVQRSGAIRWFVAESADRPVGLITSTRREGGVEIGYWVSPEHWGKGIAGAMVEEAVIVIPELFGMNTLIARVDPGNVPSARILVRRGFIRGASEAGLDRYVRKNTRPGRAQNRT